MTNREKRSILLSMVLGDGCLHLTSNKISGGLTVDHGIEQTDYVTWKAQMVSKVTDREINLRNGHKGKSVQFSVTFKKFKAWRKFCYPNNKKSISKILPFITHPEFAVAIWIMDDGYVEPSLFKNEDGIKELKSARFRIFTESQSAEDHVFIQKWFQDKLNVTANIKYYNCKRRNQKFPFIKFSEKDSLVIWSKIRDVVLKLKSMQYKFRYIESIFQSKFLQRTPDESQMI